MNRGVALTLGAALVLGGVIGARGQDLSGLADAGPSAPQVIALASAVGAEPGRLFVIGCEPGAVPPAAAPGLSAPVERAVDAAAERVEDLIRRWISRNAPSGAEVLRP